MNSWPGADFFGFDVDEFSWDSEPSLWNDKTKEQATAEAGPPPAAKDDN
jgi:hypothetical protein